MERWVGIENLRKMTATRGEHGLFRAFVLLAGTLLVLNACIQAFGQASGALPPLKGVPYSDYGLSALGSGDRVTLSLLESWTANNLTVGSFEKYIGLNLAPYDLRRVLLDIDWQNQSVGAIQRETWVDKWLTACDVMGIQNIFYVGQLTTDGVGSPWIKSAIAMNPSIQTFSSNGSAVSFVSYDSPDVSVFLEKDLATLYSFYGSHASWVGIGKGSSANDPYYQPGQLFPHLGYSNLSIASFVNSAYYLSDVNGTGFLSSGQLDPLWVSYKNVHPSILLASGPGFTTSSPVSVYGNGSLSSYIEMRFALSANVTSLGVSWYGSRVGNPGPMVIDFYADSNGSLDAKKHITGSEVKGLSITNSTGWQSGPNFPINLTAGFHWVKFSSPESDSSNYYKVYMKDQQLNSFQSLAWESYVGPGFQGGSTILWLKTQAGVTLALYPYQQVVITNSFTQSFLARSISSFNTVFLFLSDRIFNPINATIKVTDSFNSSRVLATGILSQQLGHGLEGWVPISLNETVTTTPGRVYTISLTEPEGGYSWTVALRGVSTDPPFAGFQGQASSWLFRIGYLNWIQGHLDFIDLTTNGADAVTSNNMDAVRFMPSSNETLKSVSILLASNSKSGNYTTGSLAVSVWKSSISGLAPSSPLPQTVKVPATEVPANGWLNATGFNQPLVGGNYYWIVFSAKSNESFSLGRFTNPYAFDVQVSSTGGASWQEPREGPTDFGFVVTLSRQKLGNFVTGESGIQINAKGYFAEPFYASKTTQVTGVYLGQLMVGGLLSVSINPDTGSYEPSLSPIASGVFNTLNVTLRGPDFVQFSSEANLRAGQRYWLVVHPLTRSYNLFPLVYLPDAPTYPPGAPAIISQDGGLTWKKVSNTSSTLVYELASQGVLLPELGTSELARYLSAYHSPRISEGPIHGWTGYVAVSEFSLFDQITSWLNSQSGKSFLFYGSGQPNVLNQILTKNVVVLPTAALSNSCSDFTNKLTTEMPIANVQYYNMVDRALLAGCKGTRLDSTLQMLGYMVGTGQDFGRGVSTKVLVVGDGVSDNLSRYFSIAYDSTYSQLGLNPDLEGQASLSSYNAIIWTSNENPFLSAGSSRLTDYVKGGGTLVISKFGGNNSELGSFPSSLPNSNSSVPLPGLSYLLALTRHTSYTDLTANASTTQIRGVSPSLSISIRTYGKGNLFGVWFPEERENQVSESLVLLSNIIAKSNGLPNPFWYGFDSPVPAPTIELSVKTIGGGPILVWIANTGSQIATVTLHLNGSYYGVGSSWKTLNLDSMNVSSGLGTDIILGGKLDGGSWLPAFLVKTSVSGLIEYSNVKVSGLFVYPHQSYYTLAPVRGQEVLLLLALNTTASQVLVNDNSSLPNLHSTKIFANSTSGWVYLEGSGTVLVKFPSSYRNSYALRLMALTPPMSGPPSLPMRFVLVIFVILLSAEIVVFILLTMRPKQKGWNENAVTLSAP